MLCDIPQRASMDEPTMSLLHVVAIGLASLLYAAFVVWVLVAVKQFSKALDDSREAAQREFSEGPDAGDKETLESSLGALNATLDRMLAANEGLDRKAALVPPALGVATSLVVGRLADPSNMESWTLSIGLAALIAALVCLTAAVVVLAPIHNFWVGADPFKTALRADRPRREFDQKLANSLAQAVTGLRLLILWKARMLSLSLGAFAATIGLTIVFAAMRGFE